MAAGHASHGSAKRIERLIRSKCRDVRGHQATRMRLVYNDKPSPVL